MSEADEEKPSSYPDTNNDPIKSEPKTETPNDRHFLVKFDAQDPEDPQNFSAWKKSWILLQMSLITLVGSLGTSIVAPAEPIIAAYVGVSLEASILVLALFVLGFSFGPLLWAPISEVYGRKWSMLPPVFVLGLFSIGTATSKTAAGIFITRFFGGVFGSAPISNASASLVDYYSPQNRGIAMTCMAACVVGGSLLAPVIGAAIVVNPRLGWRWTAYLEAILAFFAFVVTLLFLPETYGPVILRRKAQRLRRETGDARWWHPHEQEKMSVQNIVTKYISRPLRMFVTEPIVTCMALYASFVYGLLFLTLEVYPIVFREQRRYGEFVSTLPYLAIFVGVLAAIAINLANQPFYLRAMKRNKNRPAPEARLPPLFIGVVLLIAGLFWFGWTAAPKYHWIIPTVAGGFIGGGFSVVYQQLLNYLGDTYGPYAASALAANTFLRSLLACALPLCARPMFLNLGVGPAASLIGGIACLAVPFPFIFMKYGLALRKKSKFAPVHEG